MDNQQQASHPVSDRPSFFGLPRQMRVRHLTAQFWGGVLFGLGIGLLTGAALVELELLALQHKAWVSLTGILVAGIGQWITWRAVEQDRKSKEDKPEKA
jgi:hypothetical protein